MYNNMRSAIAMAHASKEEQIWTVQIICSSLVR
jgi:hypothetical protein